MSARPIIRRANQAVVLLIVLYIGYIGWAVIVDWHDRMQRLLAENACEENIGMMRLCLAFGASPNGDVGGTGPALTAASRTGRINSIRFLLSHGSDINIHDKWGFTPLMQACDHGQLETCRFLLDAGADPNIISEGYQPGLTALVLAHDPEIKALLLRHGAKPQKDD